MNFWLRNIILGFFLAVLAWGFLANKDLLLSLSASTQEEAEVVVQEKMTAEEEIRDKKKQAQKRKAPENAAAAGLSKFYAKLHGDMEGSGPRIRNNVVYLTDPNGDLNKLLQAREIVVRPYKKNWQGSTERRRFNKGATLLQKLTEYSEQEGLQLFWWLNRDYIIKDAFIIKKDMLKTSYQVAKAVEGHFQQGLSIFFCYRQRAIVVIESDPHPFLDEECIMQKGNY